MLELGKCRTFYHSGKKDSNSKMLISSLFPICLFLSFGILSEGMVSITTYDKRSYQGDPQHLQLTECVPILPLTFNLISIKVHRLAGDQRDCVQLYSDRGCRGAYFEMRPDSIASDDILKWLYWHERVQSLGPCEDFCDFQHQSELSRHPFMEVSLHKARYYAGLKVSVELRAGECTNIPGEMEGKVSSIKRERNNSCVELYEEEGCQGKYVQQRMVSSLQNHLTMEVFDNKAKSLSFCGYQCKKQTTRMPITTERVTTPTPSTTTTEAATTTTTEKPTTTTTRRPATTVISTTRMATTKTTSPSPTTTTERATTTEKVTTTEKMTPKPVETTEYFVTIAPKPSLMEKGNHDTSTTTEVPIFPSVSSPPPQNPDLIQSLGITFPQLIIFLFLGLLAVLLLVVLLVVLVVVRQKLGKHQTQPQPQLPEAPGGTIGRGGGEFLGVKDLEEFLRGCDPQKVISDAVGGGTGTYSEGLLVDDTYAQVCSQPYNKSFEISKESVAIDRETILGFGQFAIVYKGRTNGRDVAIKTIKENSGPQYIKALLNEIKIMIYVGSNQFIIELVGCFTENVQYGELFIMTELCENGSLLRFLQKNKDSFMDLLPDKNDLNIIKSARGTSTTSANIYEYEQCYTRESRPAARPPISINAAKEPVSIWNFNTLHLIEWCLQIGKGMEYLASKNVIHGDLATRNVLLDHNFQVKISDFGLSRQLLQYQDYIKQNREPLPWRWLSIEALKSMTFSTESDMWSYGVTAWEIFTLGDMPYPGRIWDQTFVVSLGRGLRLPKPRFCTEEMYKTMQECWKECPTDRITFSKMCTKLKEIGTTVESQLKRSNRDSQSE